MGIQARRKATDSSQALLRATTSHFTGPLPAWHTKLQCGSIRFHSEAHFHNTVACSRIVTSHQLLINYVLSPQSSLPNVAYTNIQSDATGSTQKRNQNTSIILQLVLLPRSLPPLHLPRHIGLSLEDRKHLGGSVHGCRWKPANAGGSYARREEVWIGQMDVYWCP